jgi:hypothetical protein
MTTLYHSFPLKCVDLLKEETLTYMNQFHGDMIYVKELPASSDLVNVFNQEMNEYGLSGAWNFLCFKRKYFFKETTTSVHIDTGAGSDLSRVYSSIVIPVEGCEDTYMYWVDGMYDVVPKTTSYGSYMSLGWKNNPTILDRIEISKEPTLTRVDIPHCVTSRKDGSYRTVLTIRLLGNPTFDEIIKQRFDNKSQS